MNDHDDRLQNAMAATEAAAQFESRRFTSLPKAHPLLGASDVSDVIEQIITERKDTHGDFADDAGTSQSIKSVMRLGKNWEELTPVQKEALEQIATKIGRILSGDPNHLDSWRDIQGYAKLVEDRL